MFFPKTWKQVSSLSLIPVQKDFSRKIAQKYKDEFSGNAEILDLYDEQWQQPFWHLKICTNILKMRLGKRFKKIQKADELVFIFSALVGIYTSNFKRILLIKILLLDSLTNMKMENQLDFSQKNGRNFFITCDGPKWMYALLLFPFYHSQNDNTSVLWNSCHHKRLYDQNENVLLNS